MIMTMLKIMMIRTTIIQEIGLEDRLKPNITSSENVEVITNTYQCCQEKFGKGMHSKLACNLLRSPSLERLRQFPSYLCTRGSYDFKIWLENSRTALSNSISRSLQLAHEILFVVFLYSVVLTILAQVCIVINTVVFCNVPRGPTFLYVTTSMLSVIMFIAVPYMNVIKPKIQSTSKLTTETISQEENKVYQEVSQEKEIKSEEILKKK